MVAQIIQLLQEYGLLIIFVCVFIEQIGLPIPAYPSLLVTSALSNQVNFSSTELLFTAVVAAVIADFFWYSGGRKYGNKVMTKLCRISISPESCIRQTEALYLRIGPSALLFCKFIPGFASVSSALAGTLGTKKFTFLVFDGLGSAIWVGSAILLGSLFSTAIDELLNVLMQMGIWGGIIIAFGIVMLITSKWIKRYQFLKSLRMSQISVSELEQLLITGQTPTIIDVRPKHLQDNGIIPGSIKMPIDSFNSERIESAPDDEIILYCACPNEVSSAKVAKMLLEKGYKHVRPLTGGIEAWISAGHKTVN